MLKNGTFSEGWTDLPPAPGNLINQQPKGWTLRWIEPGKTLFDSPDKATGVPECVHKLARQLPANEQKGAKDALILAGNAVYKIFHFGGAFGVELSQTVTGLKPGSKATLTVPVLAVRYKETDPFGTEVGVWVNGEGKWANGLVIKNRQWYRHKVEFTVPDDGRADIQIRFKNKWPARKDYFIDNVTLEAEEAEAGGTPAKPKDKPKPPPPPPPPPPPATGENSVSISAPAGMAVVTAVSDNLDQIVVVVPKGVKVEIS